MLIMKKRCMIFMILSVVLFSSVVSAQLKKRVAVFNFENKLCNISGINGAENEYILVIELAIE